MAHKIKVSEEYIETVCEWLDKWSSDEESLCIPQFLASHGIAWKYFSQLLEQSAVLTCAFEITIARLHTRWFNKALNEKNVPKHVAAMMMRYLRLYDNHTFQMEADAKKATQEPEPVRVIAPYEEENYKQIPLSGTFKTIYDANADKRRSSTQAE